ncbi:MAG: GtrA family protein [Bacteroidaceae bacterium]
MRSFSERQSGFFVFLRAQLSAQLATIFDFSVTLFLFYLCSVNYLCSTFVGALSGAVLNCVVNYEWTFKASGMDKRRVALKYCVVWGGSIALNTWGTYFFTELMHRVYWLRSLPALLGENSFLVSKVLTAILVGCFWNYLLQRRFVYRPVRLSFHVKKNRNS